MDFLLILINLFFVIFLNFPFGYLLCSKIIPTDNPVISLPIYLGVGFAFSTFVLSSIVVFSYWILIVFYGIGWIIFVLKERKKIIFQNLLRSIRKIFSTEILFPLLLFAFSFFIVFRELALMGGNGVFLPVRGDAQFGGAYTSAIITYGTTFFNYPTGCYVIAAAYSSLTGIFPGEALFFTTAMAQALIPCILFSTVYMLTKSTPPSTLAFLLSFYIPGLWMKVMLYFLSGSSVNLIVPFVGTNYNLYWNFYNGCFARVWGMLYALLLVSIIVGITMSHQKKPTHTRFGAITQSICPGSILSAVLFTYPLYAPILIIFLVLVIVVSFLVNDLKLVAINLLASTVGILSSIHFIFEMLSSEAYPGTNEVLQISITGILIIGAAVILVLVSFLFGRRRVDFSQKLRLQLKYWVVICFPVATCLFFLLVIESPLSYSPFWQYWIITPFQLIPGERHLTSIHFAVSYLSTSLGFYGIGNFIVGNYPRTKNGFDKGIERIGTFLPSLYFDKSLAISIILVVGFCPILIGHATPAYTPVLSTADVLALRWIDANVPTTDRILNDPINYNYGYIPSFSTKNLTYWVFLPIQGLYLNQQILGANNISHELVEYIFDTEIPSANFDVVSSFIADKDIRFIFVSSDRPSYYVAYWDNFARSLSNVSIVFRNANARVYEVSQ